MKRTGRGPQTARQPNPNLRVHCRRIQRMRALTEHLDCPYCFGCGADLERGEHARFCDFDPSLDPLSFGFPRRGSRFWNG